MEKKPLITIIIPTYNRANYIEETLNSILEQTYGNWECIVINDGSNDNTIEILEDYRKKDKRFLYFNRIDKYRKGAAGARNFGLDIAKERGAKYIQFFDDDDIMYPEKLELQIAPLIENLDLNFTVCKYDKLVEMGNEDSKIVRPEYELYHTHVGDAMLKGELKMNSLSVIWRMEILNRFRFNEDLSHAEEWELFTRIGYHFPVNYGVVNEYLYAYRKHPNTLTMGEDNDYKKRKTSGVIRLILMEYLTHNCLHTTQSIIYFGKNFLIYDYKIPYVLDLIKYTRNNAGFDWKIRFFLKSGIRLAKMNRRIISKIGAWV
ncbi:glycosyltransferase family 2 protein [Gramella sp. MT6]|uniref:glycosyltransferase family 2 protein n=1 Tax=Gramella sp. MT6 TaxID=2705471 RepID=UPI001C5EED92|nr:glycosyltransferase family 2 protein [Gramella sp. MT6]QYA24019.1 glycosyltransferase family 2 protein [Gramella sp. MT6]